MLCGKQCQAAYWCISALSACGPKPAVLLLLLQPCPSCGSSAEHFMERKWAELKCTPEGLLLPSSPSCFTNPVGASSWWSYQGRCPTSIKPSGRMKRPAGQWASCCFKAKMGISDFFPHVMYGQLKALLVVLSQHLGSSWGFIDASLLSMSEQSQGFGVSMFKGFRFPWVISWGFFLVLQWVRCSCRLRS